MAAELVSLRQHMAFLNSSASSPNGLPGARPSPNGLPAQHGEAHPQSAATSGSLGLAVVNHGYCGRACVQEFQAMPQP